MEDIITELLNMTWRGKSLVKKVIVWTFLATIHWTSILGGVEFGTSPLGCHNDFI